MLTGLVNLFISVARTNFYVNGLKESYKENVVFVKLVYLCHVYVFDICLVCRLNIFACKFTERLTNEAHSQ